MLTNTLWSSDKNLRGIDISAPQVNHGPTSEQTTLSKLVSVPARRGSYKTSTTDPSQLLLDIVVGFPQLNILFTVIKLFQEWLQSMSIDLKCTAILQILKFHSSVKKDFVNFKRTSPS